MSKDKVKHRKARCTRCNRRIWVPRQSNRRTPKDMRFTNPLVCSKCLNPTGATTR